MTISPTLVLAWNRWLSSPGPRQGAPGPDDSVDVLIDLLRRGSVSLVDVITGDFYIELTSKTVRIEDAPAEAAKLRAAGRTVRIEPVEDVARGVGRARVVTVRRRLNLFEICQFRGVQRLAVVAALENACRGPGVASLKEARAIFQPALMTGEAPALPQTAEPEAPQADETAPPAADHACASVAVSCEAPAADLLDELAAELESGTASSAPAAAAPTAAANEAEPAVRESGGGPARSPRPPPPAPTARFVDVEAARAHWRRGERTPPVIDTARVWERLGPGRER